MSIPKIDKAKGQIKEAVGKATGDQQLETEGQIEQATATVQEKISEIKDDVTEAVGNAIERVGEVASEIKDDVTEAVGNVIERVSAVASEIKDKVTGKG
jgi:uncharacterized protein YjbJ (UPF0337 family)